MLGKTLLTQTQTTKERERIVSRGWCLRFSLCAFAVLLWVCVCCCYRPSAFVVDFVSSRGMDWFVCVFLFLSQARALSLSVFRFSHTVSVSRNCSPFLLALISTSIWLLLPESIIFFYYVFLLPLICNNSCILRDATVCVFLCLLSAQYRRGRFALLFLPVCVCV